LDRVPGHSVLLLGNTFREIITPPAIATIVFTIGILGLFWLDRDPKARTSKGLWIPTVWLWILGSRELSKWLATFGMGPATISSELDGSPIDRNLYTALLVFGVIVLVRRGPEVGRLLRANLPIVFFFLYCGASVLWSDYPGVSFKRWIKALGDPVMVMIVLTDADRLTALKRILKRASFLLVPLNILMIKYYPDLGVHYNVQEGRRIINGLTTDKNALGATCLLFGLGCLWRFLSACRNRQDTHRARHLIVHGTLLVMIMWLFSKANSMTSLLLFALVSGLILANSVVAPARRRLVVNLLVLTSLAAVALPLFLQTGTGLFAMVGRDATLTGRTEIWRDAIAADKAPILGSGFESFWLGTSIDRGRSFHVNEAHNGYIEVYLNLGLVGVILVAVLIVTGYRNATGLLRLDPEVGDLRLAYWVVGISYACSEAAFRMMGLVWIFFLLAAIAIPKRPVSQTSRPLEPLADDVTLAAIPPGWNTAWDDALAIQRYRRWHE
jgi:exopolysaccharide production protein ExoQ